MFCTANKNNKTINLGLLACRNVDDETEFDTAGFHAVASAITLAVEDFVATGSLPDYTFKYVAKCKIVY